MSFQYFSQNHESQWRIYVNFSNTNFLNSLTDYLDERIDPDELEGLDYYEYYNLVDGSEEEMELETEDHQPSELELEQFMVLCQLGWRSISP